MLTLSDLSFKIKSFQDNGYLQDVDNKTEKK